MNRLTRITSILIQLQSKRIVTAREIAERFDISLRTVYRDIKTLEQAGIPIGSENGVGYFIMHGYSLPPISLTQEEANALIVSEQFIRSQGDKSLSEDFNSLLIKIKSVLRNSEKDQLELLENRVNTPTKGKVFESDWLSNIQKAITGARVLDIEYHSEYKNEVTTREIEPMAVYFANNAWIVVAYCRLRESMREFRLDRILKLSPTSTHFPFQSDFSLRQYFDCVIKPS